MERYRAAAKACETTVFWHAPRTPAEALRAVADDAEQLGLTEWDVYAERGPVAEVERQVAELLGKPAVAFFPSGVMAQQAALRVWTDRTHSKRVAIPDLSHLLKHEDDGPRRLHGFEFEFLTTGRETATAEGLRAPGAGARRRPGRAAAARRGLSAADLGGARRAVRRGPGARRTPARRRRPDLGVAAVLRPAPRRDRRTVRQRLRLVLQGARGPLRRRRSPGRTTWWTRPGSGAAGWAARSST